MYGASAALGHGVTVYENSLFSSVPNPVVCEDCDLVIATHADADDARFALLAYNHSVALARSGRTAAFLESCGRLARWVAGGRATAVERMIRADLDHTADALGLGRGVVAAAYGLT